MIVALKGHRVALLPQKALMFVDYGVLVISDAHLGKANHFRKSGIPVPTNANTQNTETLIQLIQTHKPSRVVFLGDLFHSYYNEEWEVMRQVTNHFQAIQFQLILGNHDILSPLQYERTGMSVHEELDVNGILLTHEPLKESNHGYFNLAGHIHPGVRLSGRGRQALTLPCFHFSHRLGLMPAFGAFTGLARIAVKKEDRVYVIADGKVMQINGQEM
jgi:DNA ligase-associated metallophosphoesterase